MAKDPKQTLRQGLLTILFVFIIFYAFSRSHDLLFGIKIKNITINGTPAETISKAEESMIKITGNAKNAVSLLLNGREISIEQTGDFSEAIALLPGYNVISLEAKDKFGYEDSKHYQLVLGRQ